MICSKPWITRSAAALFGYELDPFERSILVAGALLPIASRPVREGRVLYTAARLERLYEGTKAYSNTFELVHRRETERPNSIWQADHTPLDILLVRPDGRNAKPWRSQP